MSVSPRHNPTAMSVRRCMNEVPLMEYHICCTCRKQSPGHAGSIGPTGAVPGPFLLRIVQNQGAAPAGHLQPRTTHRIRRPQFRCGATGAGSAGVDTAIWRTMLRQKARRTSLFQQSRNHDPLRRAISRPLAGTDGKELFPPRGRHPSRAGRDSGIGGPRHGRRFRGRSVPGPRGGVCR